MQRIKKLKNLFLCFALIIISTAITKNYIVETEDENISCNLNTICPKDLLKILNNKKNDRLKIFEKYLPVQITIKNKALAKITIKKDEYLQGLEDILIPKEFFNEFITIQKKSINRKPLHLYLIFLKGLISFYFGKKTLKNIQDENFLWAMATIVPTLFYGNSTLHDIIDLFETYTKYIDEEIEIFKKQTYIIFPRKNIFGQNIFYCSSQQSKYEIYPGCELTDLFFIDRDKFSENFWDTKQIKLIYQKDTFHDKRNKFCEFKA
ncbi:MAG: hypothetical protein ABIA74_01430 [bacterium]